MDDKELIRKEALRLGYHLVGFSTLELSKQDQSHLLDFAKDDVIGEMNWFRRHLDLRLNPAQLYPSGKAKGAIVLGLYYRDKVGEESLAKSKLKVSRYAHGKDYHRVLRKRAKKLLQSLKKHIPALEGRICVDSAPIPEKILGRMAGLGWQGKNTNLIHPKLGSYFFLNVILVNIAFTPEKMVADHCRDCRLCVEACPTGALSNLGTYRIDAKHCLSYLNIEHKGQIKSDEHFYGWAFGCDICQEVCPYNRNRIARELDTQEEAFRLRPEIKELMTRGVLPEKMDWDKWSQGSPLRRISQEKLEQNLQMVEQKSQ